DDEQEGREADCAELAEHLDVEAMRIANLHRYVTVLEPPPFERPCARADDRVRPRLVQGGLPHVEAAVRGEAEEPLGLVSADVWRGLSDRVAGGGGGRPRRAR